MNNARFPTSILIKLLATFGIAVDFYFDRIDLYADGATDLAEFKKRGYSYKERLLRGNESLIYEITLLQPTVEDLARLEKALHGHYVLNYTEFALDYITQDTRQQNQVMAFLDRHQVQARCGTHKEFYLAEAEGTTYTGARSDEIMSVRYPYDPTSQRKKLTTGGSAPRVHTEVRVRGKGRLEKLGIINLDHLIQFDHPGFWSFHLDFRAVPYTELSPLLGSTSNNNVGRRSYFLRRFAEHKNCLQSLLRSNPDLAERLPRVKTTRQLESILNKAMN